MLGQPIPAQKDHVLGCLSRTSLVYSQGIQPFNYP